MFVSLDGAVLSIAHRNVDAPGGPYADFEGRSRDGIGLYLRYREAGLADVGLPASVSAIRDRSEVLAIVVPEDGL